MTPNERLSQIHEQGIDVDKRIIFLHGLHSDEDSGVNWKMSNRFIKNLHILDQSPDHITIHQQNIGGEIQSGMMIYDCIMNSPSYIKMVCHGEVMSMGTVILQAADKRVSMPNCSFMMHSGSYELSGSFKQIESEYKDVRKSYEQMINIYAEKFQNGVFFKDYSISKIKNYIKTKFKNEGDWYLTAAEALKYGLIDEIVEL